MVLIKRCTLKHSRREIVGKDTIKDKVKSKLSIKKTTFICSCGVEVTHFGDVKTDLSKKKCYLCRQKQGETKKKR
jgi:hypothetical protein